MNTPPGTPHTVLRASGSAVGVPDGQMGNSGIGHMALGCGCIVQQDLVKIDNAVADGNLYENEVLKAGSARDAIEQAYARGEGDEFILPTAFPMPRLSGAQTPGYSSASARIVRGSCDVIIDPATGEPHTQESVYPVPCLVVAEVPWRLPIGAGLASVTPTVPHLMGLPRHPSMTAHPILLGPARG